MSSMQQRGSFQNFPQSIGRLKHLKTIALTGDSSGLMFPILSLPIEFCSLQSLEHLELRYCNMLSSLPAQFGDLRNLQYIDLYYCKALRTLPISFKQLGQLRYIDFSLCLELTLHEDILENVTKLEIFKCSFCKGLKELPRRITSQAYLKELFLDATNIEELPVDIGELDKLQVLKIGSPCLTSYPFSLGNLSSLTRFTISHCPELKCLPESLGCLNSLEYLKLGWTGVEYLAKGFGELTNLQTLRLSAAPLENCLLQGQENPIS